MRKSSKKDNKDKKYLETEQEGPFKVNNLILALNKSKKVFRG